MNIENEYGNNSFLNFLTGTSLNRIGRAKYISRYMVFSLVMSLFSSIIGRIGAILESYGLDRLKYILLLPVAFISIYGVVYLNNKRFHDRGLSGWWQLLMLIPVVNFIVILYLWLAPGYKGENHYGKQAKTKTREKILACILPILIILIIVGIFATALLPRMQSAQNRARDVARKTDLSQIQSAIAISQMENGQWPGVDSATNGIPVSNISSDLEKAGLIIIPIDPIPTNKNSGLGNATSNGEYLYLVATRNSTPNGGFVLMAKTESAGGSNWVVCDNNEGKIATEIDLSNIKLCETVSEGDSCSNSNGVCTYTSNEQLRYILIY